MVIRTPREVVARVVDPELPMLTLEDLGVLRDVTVDVDTVVVTLTPTFTGCPALATMRADVLVALRRAGYEHAEVRTTLSPAWSSDWISDRGRASLAKHGISPPRPNDRPTDLILMPSRPPVCQQCGSADTSEVSHFGATACRSLHTCRACGETFDHMKEI
jgi:ring-1,2-phenylacetyl-CoA epoxidase subunit PaaD